MSIDHDQVEGGIHPEQVSHIRQQRMPSERAFQVASLFSLLKDPTRLQIMDALRTSSAGELCVSDLAAGLDRDETTISHQLRILRDQRVVAMRKVGRVVYYRLLDHHIQMLLEMALTHIAEDV
ncbi:MAG TPA: metalloregulator ArsR/SmtB family transcription factor [Dictyobacter sp.]|nr:metalloregulator ArsR/SmtB family transcription factor [Dictyobacter sp.]